MELKINLHKKDINSYTSFTLGAMFVVVGIIFFNQAGSDEKGIDGYDIAYLAFFALLGIIFMLKGFGVAFRRAFVIINDEKISLKPDLTSKVQTIYWRDIESINESSIKYIVNLRNDGVDEIILAFFNQDVTVQIKEAVEQIAKDKHIPFHPFITESAGSSTDHES